jgi:hypothetical protein
MGKDKTYVDFRMDEWGMSAQPRGLQASVRRVLGELSAEALLRLKDPRFEVIITPEEVQSVSTS